MSEPTIVVNGTQLTEAQAMAVRVAVTSFRDHDAKDPGLGDIGPLYHARLSEVLCAMSAGPLKVEDLKVTLRVETFSSKPMKRADGRPFTPGPTIRSCWRCNPAHTHLKTAAHLVCFICGREYKRGRATPHRTS